MDETKIPTTGIPLLDVSIVLIILFFRKTFPKNFLSIYIKNYLDNKQREAKEQSFKESLEATSRVYTYMEEIQKIPSVCRVSLISLSNGGSTPKLGSVMYVTSIHDTTISKIKEIEEFIKIKIDRRYIDICLNALKSSKENLPYFIDISKEQGVIKNLGELEGFTYSLLYHMYTDFKKDNMYLLMVSSNSDVNFYKDFQSKLSIDLKANSIKSEFKKYYTHSTK